MVLDITITWTLQELPLVTLLRHLYDDGLNGLLLKYKFVGSTTSSDLTSLPKVGMLYLETLESIEIYNSGTTWWLFVWCAIDSTVL